jgi:hypothetical protein
MTLLSTYKYGVGSALCDRHPAVFNSFQLLGIDRVLTAVRNGKHKTGQHFQPTRHKHPLGCHCWQEICKR